MRGYLGATGGLLGQGLPGGASPWFAPAWQVDGSGAYATPTLGAELFANGGFDADSDWTKGINWSIGSGVATAANASSALSQNTAVAGSDHVMAFELLSRTGGSLRISVSSLQQSSISTVGAYRFSAYSNGGGVGNAFGGVSFSGTIDNASLKAVTGNSQALILSQPDQVGMKLVANVNGQIMRLRWGVDDPDDPQNYLEFQFQTTISNTLQGRGWKCVAGSKTALFVGATITFVSNALVEIRRTAETTFQFWYNGSQISTDQTVSDAAILAGQYCGMAMLCDGWRVTEFQADGLAVPFDF